MLAIIVCLNPAFASDNESSDSRMAIASRTAIANRAASQRWDDILVGTWFVPGANLLAYLFGPSARNPLPVGDQTIFRITRAHDGAFSGVNSVRLSGAPSLDSSTPQPMYYKLNGLVTKEGAIRITFTPQNSGAPVTGVGMMEFVDGSWRMTMQLASVSSIYFTHWAYMTKTGTRPPRGTSFATAKWRWLDRTRWSLTDSQIGQLIFEVNDYHQGYFFGKGLGSTPVSVAGSVTPEGRLLLLIIPVNGTSITRAGEIENTGADWVMHFRSYEGTAAAGSARLLRIRNTAR